MFMKLKLREGAARDGFRISPARYQPFQLARERQRAIIGLDPLRRRIRVPGGGCTLVASSC
jgi:hypothetical protein